MSELDQYETEIVGAYERGELHSVATKDELERLKEAARATGAKDRRVNIRLSSGELSAAHSTVTTVLKWRGRYEERGIAGLADASKPGRPRGHHHGDRLPAERGAAGLRRRGAARPGAVPALACDGV